MGNTSRPKAKRKVTRAPVPRKLKLAAPVDLTADRLRLAEFDWIVEKLRTIADAAHAAGQVDVSIPASAGHAAIVASRAEVFTGGGR